MNLMNRRTALSLALAGGASALAMRAYGQAPVRGGKITVWAFDATTSAALEERFPLAFPEYELEIVRFPATEIVQRLVVALQGGQGLPDVVQLLQRDGGDLIATGQFLDLTNELGPIKDQFQPSTVIEYDDKPLAFLMGVGYLGIWHNKVALAEYGIEIPKETNWPDVIAIAEKLKEASGGTKFMLLEPSGANGFLYYNAFFNARGGNWWNAQGELIADKALAVETLEFLVDLKKRGLTYPTDWSKPEFYDLINAGTIPAFTMNYGVGFNNLRGRVPDQSGQWALTPWPTWKAGETTLAASFGGSYYAGLTGGQNNQGAKDVIMWFLSDEGIVKQSELLGFVSYNGKNNLIDLQHGDPYFNNQPIAADITSRTLPDFNWRHWTGTVSAMTNAVDLAMSGAKTPEQALTDGLQELANL